MQTPPPASTGPGTTPAPAAPPRVRNVGLDRPLAWLRLGWSDLLRCPGPGLLHGLLAALFGFAVVVVARNNFWLMAGAFSGFLIVAPVVATGLYAISRALQAGKPAHLGLALNTWRSGDSRLVRFGLLLGLAGTGWVLTSAALITAFSDVPIQRPLDFLRYVVARDQSGLFEMWLMLGGVLAAPVFASSVVALPLLLDRRVGLLQAVLTSWEAVVASPAALALWALLLLGLTALGMASLLLGLVVVVPWLAHASWHAYQDLVVPETPAAERDAR